MTPTWIYEFVGTGTPPSPCQGIMTFGLDVDTVGTNPIGKYGNVHFAGVPFVGSLSCVSSPGSADAIFDVKFSHDNGVTWTSIFPGAHPYKYPMSTTGFVLFTAFANVTFAVGDLLRVDVIQSGGAQGIEGVIRWCPLAPPKQQTILGVANIRGSGTGGPGTSSTRTISGKAAITKLGSHTITGVARISLGADRTITGKARIQVTSTRTITGVSRIWLTETRTIEGVASIVAPPGMMESAIRLVPIIL